MATIVFPAVERRVREHCSAAITVHGIIKGATHPDALNKSGRSFASRTTGNGGLVREEISP